MCYSCCYYSTYWYHLNAHWSSLFPRTTSTLKYMWTVTALHSPGVQNKWTKHGYQTGFSLAHQELAEQAFSKREVQWFFVQCKLCGNLWCFCCFVRTCAGIATALANLNSTLATLSNVGHSGAPQGVPGVANSGPSTPTGHSLRSSPPTASTPGKPEWLTDTLSCFFSCYLHRYLRVLPPYCADYIYVGCQCASCNNVVTWHALTLLGIHQYYKGFKERRL